MQAPFFQLSLLFTSLSYPTTSKLFSSTTAGTPRRRCIACPSATTPIPPSLPDSSITAFEDYQRLFSSQPAESVDPLPLVATEGSLPAGFPLGTYYLNGPGMISDDHGSIVNPLDGHGYLHAFRFIGGGVVMYSARYVETEAANEEREAKTAVPAPGALFPVEIAYERTEFEIAKERGKYYGVEVGLAVVLSLGRRASL